MNSLGIIAVGTFAVAWIGGLLAGPIAVYHLLLFYIRGGQITHRSKARKAGLATVICGDVCILTGLVGMWIGSWN
jgi:hypothetical protein